MVQPVCAETRRFYLPGTIAAAKTNVPSAPPGSVPTSPFPHT